ncbi:cupin domain-containing protein [Caulobacter sp. 602-1]|uniref:cupin domain-containing protein n=1 Tax=unclassified Caulobacter TaxID=2648921 RepID=UPI000F63FAAD|nr:cupin domain-containing protein [Caulobacter sp. 602-1]RRN66040.1 hypothetical protein EIK80_01795 [Caulobacter sp. 602-1]
MSKQDDAPENTLGYTASSAIAYSRFRMYQVDESDLEKAPLFSFPMLEGVMNKAINVGIDEPATQVNFEEFLPGHDISWAMFHDELHYVTSGECEVTYHLAPMMTISGTVIARPGCIYLLPRGAHIKWKVLGDKPFRHLCICIPNPGYPVPLADSVRRAEGGQ